MSFLFVIDPGIIIAELDPLARSVLVLRTAIRASIPDCALRLNVSRSTVLAANCRAMTWLVTHNSATPRVRIESVPTLHAQWPCYSISRGTARPEDVPISGPWAGVVLCMAVLSH